MPPEATPLHPPDASIAQPPAPRPYPLRRAAAIAFLLLLAGLLIFNRSFALIGFPPVYVSEMVLALALFATLFDFKTVFIEPLKHSRAMQCVALFMFYGIVRICFDAPSRGLDAARDGVICLYAVAAFLGPWLLAAVPKVSRVGGVEYFAEDRAIRRFHHFIFDVSYWAMLWAWVVYNTGWAPASIKVDFLSMCCAVAYAVSIGIGIYWVILLQKMRASPDIGKKLPRLRRRARWQGLFCAAISLISGMLVLCLPTRALLPALLIPPLVSLAIIFAKPGARKKVIFAILLMAIIGGGTAYYFFSRSLAARERIEAIADPNESHFQTAEGQRAAHSVKWRLTFWRRCIDETLHRAPLFGLGFGTNLTELLRGTPDWPMFEDSQNAAKYGSRNRHPHSAHVTVFARLGGLGLALWIALLALVFLRQWSALWNYRGILWLKGLSTPTELTRFCDFPAETMLLSVWLIYLLAMSFGVVLENPFGGIWFWTITGLIANRAR
ncbi:MAG TPA: O-antigen ligase family protein [Planctomycetota bacterium]|nr:O-antigen ligase family protein [Planctomycetota bacterium]